MASEGRKHYNTIDEFIADFPKDVQKIMEKIRKLIHDLVPDCEEAMNYQIPTFRLKKKNMVHFAAFKTHIGFFPTPSGIVAFQSKLTAYKTSKGTVQFPLNKPIPYDLIKEMVLFRKDEIVNKK
jgi:uncharacterized protein YdhG (YjbR/CyaY superfamily)